MSDAEIRRSSEPHVATASSYGAGTTRARLPAGRCRTSAISTIYRACLALNPQCVHASRTQAALAAIGAQALQFDGEAADGEAGRGRALFDGRRSRILDFHRAMAFGADQELADMPVLRMIAADEGVEAFQFVDKRPVPSGNPARGRRWAARRPGRRRAGRSRMA